MLNADAIPLACLRTILFTYIDVSGSIMCTVKLRKHYERLNINDLESGQFPTITGNKTDRLLARISSIALPALFVLAWTVMWIAEG
ncbi:MAG TPA: hypothetical protein VEV83_12515 [Parafilimonas sp.]|nr:hypothetical protein [Parafilimonas sp.]